MTVKVLTQSRLKELLHYSPDTGMFTWRTKRRGVLKGRVAGGLNGGGYVRMKIDGHEYYAHRMAHLYMTGEMPDEVDHEDHVRDNNRWENIIPSSRSENGKNVSMRSINTSGVTGVLWDRNARKWRAYITVNRDHKHIGLFESIEDATVARKAADIKYGFHPNHGRA